MAATTPRLSEAEAKEQAEKAAQAALQKTPEPRPVALASSFEQNAEADAKTEAAENIINDRLNSDVFLRRLATLEALFDKQNKVVLQMLERQGFRTAEAEHEAPIATAPAIPLDAIITIYIPEGSTPQDREAIPVGVNGNVRFIPRGQYVQVTKSELEVLQNAVYEGEMYPVANDTPLAKKLTRDHLTPSQPVPYRQQRFPLMVHSLPVSG